MALSIVILMFGPLDFVGEARSIGGVVSFFNPGWGVDLVTLTDIQS